MNHTVLGYLLSIGSIHSVHWQRKTQNIQQQNNIFNSIFKVYPPTVDLKLPLSFSLNWLKKLEEILANIYKKSIISYVVHLR